MLQTRRKMFVSAGLLAFGMLSAGMVGGCGSGNSHYNDSLRNPTPTPSPTATPTQDVSRFVGSWSGPFTLNTGQSGLTEVSISNTGAITGITVSSEDGEAQGPANGLITGAGVVDVTFVYGSFTITCRGTMAVNSAGDELSGTLTRIVNGSSVGTVQVTLNRGQLQN